MIFNTTFYNPIICGEYSTLKLLIGNFEDPQVKRARASN